MPVKIFDLPDIGSVKVYKRRNCRTMRLSFDNDGSIKLSIPSWVPYQAGLKFAQEKKAWIIKHQSVPTAPIMNGDKVGKAHHIIFERSDVKTVQSRLKGSLITVKYPLNSSVSDDLVQRAAFRGAKKALMLEAEQLLPQRIELLADQYGFSYKNVAVKQLKSKWGSCNQHKEITLNYYLMQLPWKLIDYVLIHELVHTEHLNHSQSFWERFEMVLPNAKKIRKELKPFKTSVVSSSGY